MLKNRSKYAFTLVVSLLCTTTALANSNYFYDSSEYGNAYADTDNSFSLNDGLSAPTQTTTEDDSDNFARTGNDYYFYAGYMYSEYFNKSLTQSFFALQPSSNTLFFSSKDLKSTFNNVQVGVGRQWGRHLDFQLTYIYRFKQTSKNIVKQGSAAQPKQPGSAVKVMSQGADFNFKYIVNPDDQFKAGFDFGFMIENTSEDITFPGGFLVSKDFTEFNPELGIDFIYQFTSSFSMMTGVQYQLNTSNDISSGQVNGLIGMLITI